MKSDLVEIGKIGKSTRRLCSLYNGLQNNLQARNARSKFSADCLILNYARDLLLAVENLLFVVAWYQFAAQLTIPRVPEFSSLFNQIISGFCQATSVYFSN